MHWQAHELRLTRRAAGLKKIGAHLCQACTGQLTTTLHWHEVDEEAFYIVSGRGLLLIKETADSEVREHTVEAGDFIGFPACAS